MNIDHIHDALNLLDDDIIEAVDELRKSQGNGRKKRRKSVWLYSTAVAACLCVVVLGAYIVGKPQMKQSAYGKEEIWIGGEEDESYFNENSAILSDEELKKESTKQEEMLSVEIVAWNGNEFVGCITDSEEELAASRMYEIGSEVTIKCSEDIKSTDFPVGSIVVVKFYLTENTTSTDTKTILSAKSVVLSDTKGEEE